MERGKTILGFLGSLFIRGKMEDRIGQRLVKDRVISELGFFIGLFL